MENINFTAFDFETAQSHKNACQIGLVVVRKGKIVEEKSYLIQPPDNKISSYCTKIHGIKASMTKNAPLFNEVWEEIKPYFEKQVIVHHSDGFDMRILNQEFDFYNIEPSRFLGVESTMFLFPDDHSRSLANLCKAYHIEMEKHHDGLSDARCCAEIFIKYLMKEDLDFSLLPKVRKNQYSDIISTEKDSDEYQEINIKHDFNFDNPDRKITSETRTQDLSIVKNTDTIFYDKKIVISGVFERFPIRNDLGILLKGYGAKINTSLSKNVNYFIAGSDCGPVKLNKVLELKDNDVDISIIEEKDLYKILDSIDKNN